MKEIMPHSYDYTNPVTSIDSYYKRVPKFTATITCLENGCVLNNPDGPLLCTKTVTGALRKYQLWIRLLRED